MNRDTNGRFAKAKKVLAVILGASYTGLVFAGGFAFHGLADKMGLFEPSVITIPKTDLEIAVDKEMQSPEVQKLCRSYAIQKVELANVNRGLNRIQEAQNTQTAAYGSLESLIVDADKTLAQAQSTNSAIK